MAYTPVTPGWGAAASFAKPKPKPKPPGSFDPSGALGGYSPKQIAAMTPEQVAMIQFGLRMQGAPAPDFDKLRAIAQSQVEGAYAAPKQAIADERQWLRGNYDMSTEAATNYAAAFADILQGGKTGEEGQQYALEHFGGSYLAGLAARMGQQLISQQTSYFNEEDAKLKNQLADMFEAMPDEAEKVYAGLVENTQDILTAGYKEKLAAWAALEVAKRNTAKAQADQGSGGVTKPRIFQTSEGVFAINEATGQVVWEKKNGKAKTTKVTTQVVEQPDGSKNLIDKTTGKVLKVVAPPDPTGGATSNGEAPSTSSMSTTVARAQKAAEDVLGTWTDAIRQKYALPQDASDAAKAANTKKYQAELSRNFGRAMFKVITAIAPHLKAIGYTHARIKWEAYQMVRAAGLTPLPTYKAPKPPKADAARVAASNTPLTLDFGSLSQRTVGRVGQDLGGPEAHHARPLGNWQSDNAWDIGIPIGTPIYAVADGVVGPDVGAMASRPGDGQRLTLSATDNDYWYGHLSRISVKPGQRVRAGQLLGYSGASANGAAHLHLGVRDLGGTRS